MKKNPIRLKENRNRNRTLIGTRFAIFNADSDIPEAEKPKQSTDQDQEGHHDSKRR